MDTDSQDRHLFTWVLSMVSLPVVRQGDKPEPVSCHSPKHHLPVAKELKVEEIKTKTVLLRVEFAIVIFLKSHTVKLLLNMHVWHIDLSCSLPWWQKQRGQIHDWLQCREWEVSANETSTKSLIKYLWKDIFHLVSAKWNIYSNTSTPTCQVQGPQRKKKRKGDGRSPEKQCLLQLMATAKGESLLFKNAATTKGLPMHTQVMLTGLSGVQKKRGTWNSTGGAIQRSMWKTGKGNGSKYGYCIYVWYSWE